MRKCLRIFISMGIISIVFFSILGFTKGVASNNKREVKDNEVLMTGLNDSGAQLEGIHLNFWSKLLYQEDMQKEMKKTMIDFARELGFQESEIKISQKKTYNKIVIKAQRKDQILATILMEETESLDQEKEIYFLVDIILGQDYKNPSPIERKVANYFEQLNLDYQYATTIVGTFEKQMNTDKMRRILGNTFKKMKAEVLEGMQEEQYSEMVSLSGYSRQIQNSIQLAGREVNLNGAMRYNKHDQKTYIWIGSPLIAIEY